jgi:hypothetical protein
LLVAAIVPPPVEDGLRDEVGIGRHFGVEGAVDACVGHGLKLRADILGVPERHVLATCKLRRGCQAMASVWSFIGANQTIFQKSQTMSSSPISVTSRSISWLVSACLISMTMSPDVKTCSLYRNSSRAMSPRVITPVPFLST